MIRDMKIIKNYFAAIRKNEVFMHSWNDWNELQNHRKSAGFQTKHQMNIKQELYSIYYIMVSYR